MGELVLMGSLEEIRGKTQAVMNIIDRYNATGWLVFQADETWQYVIHPEIGTVCPLCKSFSEMRITGTQIPIQFPYYTYDPSSPFMARPRTHQPDLSQFFDEECHCDLIWLDPLETLEKRLHAEKEAVI